MVFNKLEGENEEQFIWRIGQAKDAGLIDAGWDEIAELINRLFREDEFDYRSEAAYRKPYQQAKRFFEAQVFNNGGDYVSDLREARYELQKEKQRMSDERTALNRSLRESARLEEDLANLENLIKQNGMTTMPETRKSFCNSDNDLFVALSDFHLGLNTNNYFGTYNSDIAKDRLFAYLEKIVEIKELHHSENAYLMLLGDLLNGEIHFTTQLENRENISEQVQKTAELISAFTYELSKHFQCVYVNGVAGNHSRTSFKDQVLRNNRLDNLIPWYMKAKLSHLSNVVFIDQQNIDPSIGHCTVRGNEYLLVHGDFDSYSEKGVSKLVMMLDFKPNAIFYGHLHRCSYDDIAGIKIIRSGSFSGASDDYSVSKRLNGKPTQMVTVVTSDGIKSCYPVDL